MGKATETMEDATTGKAIGKMTKGHFTNSGARASACFNDGRGKAIRRRNVSQGCLAALLIVLIGISWDVAICQAQQPESDVPGAQVLTRGPVHEAFAGMMTFNPEPGVVVTKAPPAVIEEVPPEEKPEGDNVTWIPGYWGWDDERSDFLWVSGIWRALPPGREWIAGYWAQTPQGYQWTSGYWADSAAREATYLPPPPATLEVGPNVAAPSMDYGWTPGCWVWYQGRYAWRPGYWARGRADWDWSPAHYAWTPRGYIFVGGFWDYPVERRGVLFAPVYFESGLYSRRGYSYSPTIVIDLGVFTDHLFLRPRYHHYYFGDYYSPSYYQGGFYTSFSFQSRRYGYDPIYSHQRWEHRQDREWERRVETSYQYRRDHEAARPPRTWVAQRNMNPSAAEFQQNRVLVAAPINQLAKRNDGPVRFQTVASEERQKLARRGQEVQQSRDQRRTLEAKAVDTTARKANEVFEPVKVQLPRSPIVAKSPDQLGRTEAPPKAQQAPRPDRTIQSRSEPLSRPPGMNRSNPQLEPRKPESESIRTPGGSEAAPPGRPVESGQRQNEAPNVAQEKSRETAAGSARKDQFEPEQRVKEPEPRDQPQSPRIIRGWEKRTPANLEPRARQSEVRVPAQPQRPDKGKQGAVKRGPPGAEELTPGTKR